MMTALSAMIFGKVQAIKADENYLLLDPKHQYLEHISMGKR